MDPLDLARLQFGATTVYHFIFVPLTIGLAPLVAIMQTIWVRTGNERWLRLTKFFGKLLLINFAIGVATGIVQEFQFGMNWSEYSRFVGDVFGAPLAMEALAAFFVESTFLGLWIFGWDKLPKKIHLATIWAVALSTNLSAFFILAANSWMQHPVGAVWNEATGRAEMNDIGAVLTNSTLWAAFPHTITAAFVTAGTFVAGIAAWWMVRLVRAGQVDKARDVYRPAVVLGVIVMFVAGIGVALSGDQQAKLMFQQQPMKMSSAEALCETVDGASFSLLAIGDLSNSCEGVNHVIEIPGLTSFLASGDWNAPLPGVRGPAEAVRGEVRVHRRRGQPDLVPAEPAHHLLVVPAHDRLRHRLGRAGGLRVLGDPARSGQRQRRGSGGWRIVALATPFLASSFGWIFTEMGRQPWVVAPNPTGVDGVWLLTQRGVSTVVGTGTVVTSLVSFTLLYGVLAVFWYRLMHRYTIEGVADSERDYSPDNPDNHIDPDDPDAAERPLSFAY